MKGLTTTPNPPKCRGTCERGQARTNKPNNTKENDLRPLPEGWVWTTIGEVTSPIEKVSPRHKPDIPFVYIDISSIDNSLQKIVEPKEYLGLEAPSRARQLVHANDVVFSTVRTYLKNVALIPQIYDGQIASTGFSVLRGSDSVNAKFLFYYTLTDEFLSPLNELQRGTSYPAVRDGDVRVQPFPLPPLPEQERIVARLEELLSDLEAGVAALERVRAGAKRYKASVLKAAVEGRLFGEKTVGLPEGWRWVKAEEICKFITKGTTPKANKLFAGSGEIPFIKVYNLTFNGTLAFLVNPTFVSKQTHNGELARSKIFPGDVLMNIVGPPLGKVSIVPDIYPEWNINQAIARFRPLPDCDAKYLATVLLSDNTLKWATKRAKATAGQFNLTLEICRELPISLPPLEEQRRIVAEVEQRLESVRAVESAVEAGLKRAGNLRQAVLRAAFEGRLID